MPMGIPATVVIMTGAVSASTTMAVDHPNVSPSSVAKLDTVSAKIPQIKRNTSRFSSTFLTLNGRTRTTIKIPIRRTFTIVSWSIGTNPVNNAAVDEYSNPYVNTRFSSRV
jgi:hypothetical protein